MRIVLQILKDRQLYAMFSTCDVWLESVTFFVPMILGAGIHIDPQKKNQ